MEKAIKNKIEEICTYLENKYNRKFIVDRLVSDDGNPKQPNKAYAYTEGCKNEWFAVRFEMTEDTGECIYSDGYGFILAEQVLLPDYRDWISEDLPDGKITIYIEGVDEVTNGNYSNDFNFEEFVKAEPDFAINVTIFAGSDLLSDKPAFFEKLSHSIDKRLKKEFCYKINIAFTDEKSGCPDVDDYRAASLFVLKSAKDKFVAYTKVFVVNEMSQSEIFNELNDEFTDNMEVSLFGIKYDGGSGYNE